MLSLSTRPFNEEEKIYLKKGIPSTYKKIERFVTVIIIGGAVSGPAFFGLTDRYEVTQLLKWSLGIVISLVLIAIGWWWAIWKTELYAKAIKHKIETGTAEVFNVKPFRVVERKDPEDFGPAYYFDVEYHGKKKTLFLWGQYFYFTEDENFPAASLSTSANQITKNLFR